MTTPRVALVRRGLVLTYATLAYNCLEDSLTKVSAAEVILSLMGKWLLLRSTPRPRLVFRALMLVLITGGVLGRGAEINDHCTRHSPGAADHPGMAMPEGPVAPDARSAALVSSGHQCPHCPPAECATALPCASGPSSQSAPGAGAAVPGVAAQSLRDLTPVQQAASVHDAPLTPPPQAAA
jgi:hypothetical protein